MYQLTEEIALIQTVDFFTPIVDDPYAYGQIAAANSLSDVYAMGGQPLTALNIVGFPQKTFENEVLSEILRGGYDKVQEAGALIVGGHTIQDDELKYGLAVTGQVHPKKVVTNAAAQPGDKLILTKPVGTGILSTALKAGRDLGELTEEFIRIMATLNRAASEAMPRAGVNACTDISGFGLLGHGYEMAAASKVAFRIWASEVPCFVEALPLVSAGFVPGGTGNNRFFLENKVFVDDKISWELSTLFFDAQTSGGLLISLAEEKVDDLTAELKQRGVETVAVIGEVLAGPEIRIDVLS